MAPMSYELAETTRFIVPRSFARPVPVAEPAPRRFVPWHIPAWVPA